MPVFNPLTNHELAAMVSSASILEQDSYGPKVYQLQDGNILKLFRRKRLLSSALLRPHSLRFCQNARALKKIGIQTVDPIRIYRLEDASWTAVLYGPLAGKTISQLIREQPLLWSRLKPRLATFIGMLHYHGVYFRSLHLGNIVVTPDDRLGLIDISDLQFRHAPLGRRLIRRNQEHFEKYLRKEQLELDCTGLWPSSNVS